MLRRAFILHARALTGPGTTNPRAPGGIRYAQARRRVGGACGCPAIRTATLRGFAGSAPARAQAPFPPCRSDAPHPHPFPPRSLPPAHLRHVIGDVADVQQLRRHRHRHTPPCPPESIGPRSVARSGPLESPAPTQAHGLAPPACQPRDCTCGSSARSLAHCRRVLRPQGIKGCQQGAHMRQRAAITGDGADRRSPGRGGGGWRRCSRRRGGRPPARRRCAGPGGEGPGKRAQKGERGKGGDRDRREERAGRGGGVGTEGRSGARGDMDADEVRMATRGAEIEIERERERERERQRERDREREREREEGRAGRADRRGAGQASESESESKRVTAGIARVLPARSRHLRQSAGEREREWRH